MYKISNKKRAGYLVSQLKYGLQVAGLEKEVGAYCNMPSIIYIKTEDRRLACPPNWQININYSIGKSEVAAKQGHII
jgi:hypothetical protein